MGARYVIGDWRAVKSALAGGATIRGAAESTGVGRGAVLFLIAFIFRKSRDKSFGFHDDCFAS